MSTHRPSTRAPVSQTRRILLIAFVALIPLLLGLVGLTYLAQPSQAAENASPLDVKINAAYNLVVDSNVSSPSTYAPSVATVIGEFCNTSGSVISDVQGFIGDWQGNLTSSTPGTYPIRDSSTFTEHPELTGTGSYAFEHVGGRLGSADARRYMGDIQPGECKVQYWHFT